MAKSSSRLTPELIEKAKRELNEDQSKVPGQIQSLRQKILDNPNFNFRTDDTFLLRFLRARKFDEEKALELITNYYKQRTYYADTFKVSATELEKAVEPQILGVLPGRDSEGRAVILLSSDRWKTDEICFDMTVYLFSITLELLMEDESVQINGIVFIFNLEGYNISHVACMTPWAMKKAISLMMNNFPARIKGIHYINEPSFFDGVFMIIKPFLSKKLQERIVFHGDICASLHGYVSPEILPDELGGNIDTTDHSDWNARLLDYSDTMNKNLKYGVLNIEEIERKRAEEEKEYSDKKV